ncbi:MAG: HAD family hydrolase [Geodermatophilaceae bacterium]|jgi:putative hydrolase of the HAD superfamily|nr:HAD family hydrolase [Geodermatophilaceae bacterium]
MRGVSVLAVIFDWGGTLTPWHTIEAADQWAAFARVAHADRPTDAEEAAARLLAAELRVWEASRDHHSSARFADVLAAAGVDPHEAAELAYREFWDPHTFIDPDVPDLFAALRDRGIKIGVLSNTIWDRAWHEAIFERDGVLHLIDGAVYTSEVPWTKPHPEAFRAAMAAAGVEDPARCVFVGDRPFDDISGARAVGMRAVLVPHSEIPPAQQVPVDVHPDAVIDRLRDLLPLVDTWSAPR